MTTARGEVTGKKPAQTAGEAKRLPGPSIAPITVTIREACRLSGFGTTTIWALVKQNRLKIKRVPGVARTLIDFASLQALLAPDASNTTVPPPRRPRGRSRRAESSVSR